MINFELQSGEGTNVEIFSASDWDDTCFIIDEDTLVRMIQLAFGCKKFTINHLIDALRIACEDGPQQEPQENRP